MLWKKNRWMDAVSECVESSWQDNYLSLFAHGIWEDEMFVHDALIQSDQLRAYKQQQLAELFKALERALADNQDLAGGAVYINEMRARNESLLQAIKKYSCR